MKDLQLNFKFYKNFFYLTLYSIDIKQIPSKHDLDELTKLICLRIFCITFINFLYIKNKQIQTKNSKKFVKKY